MGNSEGAPAARPGEDRGASKMEQRGGKEQVQAGWRWDYGGVCIRRARLDLQGPRGAWAETAEEVKRETACGAGSGTPAESGTQKSVGAQQVPF